MAAIGFPAELQKNIQESGPVDLVIGITGTAEMDALRTKTRVSLNGTAAKTVITYAGDGDITSWGERVRFAPFPMPVAGGSLAIWADVSAAQRSILALAAAWQARACVVIHGDLAALESDTIKLLTDPVLQGQSDLVMPVYPYGKYDGLMNKSLLAPMSRALYGRRVRFPIAAEFCAGANVLTKLVEDGGDRARGEEHLLWPANVVAVSGGQIGQADVNVRRAAQIDDIELSAVMAEFAGSLFQEAEMRAAQWQRVRGSQPVPHYGCAIPLGEESHSVDPRPLVESFVFGSRNLEEVWRLVLPPATMLDLKRLARMNVEQFRMPDALWARIIYDFALAHRMRRVSRSHVLGALTPLYLGWVASYTQEVRGATAQEADQRIEQLARAYEEQKPYFVSRWRWPERAT